MAEMESVYNAIRAADAAGDIESVRRLTEYIQQAEPATPEPAQPDLPAEVMQETPEAESGAVRGLGLGTRAVLEGAAGLPLMAGDAANVLVNKVVSGINRVTGSNIPMLDPASDAFKQILTDIGLPEPETTGEKVRSEIQKGAAGTLAITGPALAAKPLTAVGKKIAAELATKPTLQATAGGAAGAGSEIAEELGAGEVGQAVAGITAAGFGAVGAAKTVGLMTAIKESAPKLSKEYARIVTQGINKGIRPSVAGKGTYSQAKAYEKKSADAVGSIIDNKPNLQLTDDYGDIVAEKLPENLRQFSQSIEQTKQGIFEQYNTMAKEAGEEGAKISLSPAVKELKKITTRKAIQDNAPETVAYAEQRLDALAKRGSYTAEEGQEAVKIMNQSLDSFYKNPSPDTASRAYVDALVSNNIRKSLDKAITGLKGPGYQELKRKYGALKTIEKEVSQRAIVDARKNKAGLVDFTSVMSGDRAVHGILSMNPVSVGQGAAIEGIKAIIKTVNDPNRTVKKMFIAAEKIRNNPNFVK